MKLRLTSLLLLLAISCAIHADIANEQYGAVTLDEIPEHSLLVNTFNDRAILFDMDTQQMLGMLSYGLNTNAAEIDRGANQAYIAETYLSRLHRGERTDVITTYDLKSLSAVGEIVIPPKHASGSPMRHYSGILTEGRQRLMLVTNITPAVSVSVADLGEGEFLNEISSAGCGLVYPADGLAFMQICGDGTIQLITLNKKGEETGRYRSEEFFSLEDDPLMEKGVELNDGTWLFNTFKGRLFQVSASGTDISIEERFTISDEDGAWRVGGMQPLAYHSGQNLLLALMHQGGEDTHKDAGTEVWYYDLDSGLLKHRLTLANPTTSIQVSQDDAPLLYGGSTYTDSLDIYDLKTTTIRGTIESVGFPTILQNL